MAPSWSTVHLLRGIRNLQNAHRAPYYYVALYIELTSLSLCSICECRAAATRIQSLARGAYVRRKLAQILEIKEQNHAVVKIQAVIRAK
jgi:hypothetical protein